ncbi:hypothetical protein ACE2AJ_13480 [Aquihabitans daechungensis]|uniref:hypothetical protein n=1 Tax=Aquihabitans daechungensis TaxID=1052257 RepID=UPI003BA29ECE
MGLGNHLANQQAVPRSDGLTAVLVASKQDGGRYRVDQVLAIPTWIEPGSFRVLPIPSTLRDPNLPAGLRSELVASYERTAAVLRATPTDGVAIVPRP